MYRRIPYLVLFVVISTIVLSNTVGSIDLSGRPRVRIDKIVIPNLVNNEVIKVNETFKININISKERLLPFSGEIIVYLTFAGFIQQEIGRSDDIKIRMLKFEESTSINCIIDTFDVNNIQEKYSIVAVLYTKRLRGGFVEIDRSSIENVNIVTEWWEKNKVIISDFKPPENWPKKNNNVQEFKAQATANKEGIINIHVSNFAAYNFSIKVKINLIEKPSSNIPFIDGFGELKKEIGCNSTYIPPGEKNKKIIVNCNLRKADIERKKLDVQAVLYVETDGQWYEVDTSSIQSIYVPLSDDPLDWIKEYGLWIWGIFVAGIGTILLIAVTFRLFLPYYKLKSKELKQKAEKLEEKKKKRG